MKDEAMRYLNKDKLNHIDMIIAINYNAIIMKVTSEGVLLKTTGEVYMLSCHNTKEAKQ